MAVTAAEADAFVGALAQFLPRYFDRASGLLRQEMRALRDTQAEAMTRQAVVIEQLSQRLAALEARPEPAPRGIDYERLEALQARCLEAVDVRVRDAVAALPRAENGKDGRDGVDGRDADMEALRRDLASMVAALPKAEDGKDGRDGVDGVDGRDGADGKDGRDADMEALRRDLASMVAALPKAENGKDGRDADMEALRRDLASMAAALPKAENGKDGRDGVDGVDGKDGAGITEAIVDAQGTLHLTLSDGRMLKAEGLRGQDGLGFEDLAIERKSERVMDLVFRRDGRERRFELSFPVPIYRGVHQDQAPYQQGDMVTKDGAMWVAMSDLDGSEGRPGASPAWKLAVKRGPAARTAPR